MLLRCIVLLVLAFGLITYGEGNGIYDKEIARKTNTTNNSVHFTSMNR